MTESSICILGCGNIGSSIAKGLIKSNFTPVNNITLTKRKTESLNHFKKSGFKISNNNIKSIKKSNIIIICVSPHEIFNLLDEISSSITNNQLIISVVSGVSIKQIQLHINKKTPIVRAMPNTAADLCESMTCLSTIKSFEKNILDAQNLFNSIGKTLIINEDQMASATALGACGIAFFLRAIRAASQGGIEIGFQSEEAFIIASQTARGAASLLLDNHTHPESEIDRVTTPMGATISGLNEMEHQGFSSAMIRGITTSTKKVEMLLLED